MGDRDRPFKRTPDAAAAAATLAPRPRSEATTLVFAVALAVALGVACGVWMNSLMASASSAGRTAPPPRVPSDARADAPPPADEAGTPQSSTETADAGAAAVKEPLVTENEPLATEVEARASRPAATHAAREAGPRPKVPTVEVSPGTRWEVVRKASPGKGQGRGAPCALYASAAALTLRGGGAAPLVLGGPGEAGRVSVTTPDWSNIALFYEGRTGNGWSKYSVRSVSGRPGVYAVRYATPCGSQTVRVTVK